MLICLDEDDADIVECQFKLVAEKLEDEGFAGSAPTVLKKIVKQVKEQRR